MFLHHLPHLPFYLDVFSKLVIGCVFVLGYLNLSGRNQLSQMNAIDLIANFILGAIIGNAIVNPTFGIVKYMLVLVIAEILLWALQIGVRKIDWLRHYIVGVPIPIIRNGRFLMNEIAKHQSKIDLLNISSQLNLQGISSFDEIYYAQIEPNGQVAAISDPAKLPAVVVMYQGAFRKASLDEIKMSEDSVKSHLNLIGVREFDDVFLCEYKNGRFQCVMQSGAVLPNRDWYESQAKARERQEAEKSEKNRFYRFLPYGASLLMTLLLCLRIEYLSKKRSS